ncbi:AAA family ATPase [Pontibacter sp. G13]|uniref:AAA family ATPase n=1 Tax=Pontibacter sp. G13 TaxID=3074898 RepID=UPI00288C5426|nr:AAA family ATPase [Pontibacter sp. G13]WNJ19287.1 AAA family ATPase [Pontibacter sp. G13]
MTQITSQTQPDFSLVSSLQAVLDDIKSAFVGKDEIVDLMGVCLVGRENLFLLGPPGTAKSALVRALSERLNGQSFEYLLTRFTEPNELFGPFDIRKLREGELVTNTAGMLPEATLVFLDELLNANSAILNSLLMVLNERIFVRGQERKKLPVLMTVGASNHLPEDDALKALFDRFLLRVRCDNVDPTELRQVLQAGWQLEHRNLEQSPEIFADQVRQLQAWIPRVDLSPILDAYLQLVQQLRNVGIPVSDRRAVKLQRMIAASALLCHRLEAEISDLWVLRYIWETEDQIEVVNSIVQSTLSAIPSSDTAHPRSHRVTVPDPDQLYAEIMEIQQAWESPETDAGTKSLLKDRLRHVGNRAEWITNSTQRAYLQDPIDQLWNQILAEG